MKKRIYGFVIAVLLCMLMLPVTAFAAETIEIQVSKVEELQSEHDYKISTDIT